MKRSRIGWTDFSGGNLNPVLGCTPVSTGCANCYARRLYERWGKDFSRVTICPEKLERLRTQAFPQEGNVRGLGKRPLCFFVDMGDPFHEQVPDDFILTALDIMAARTDVVWQMTTKRAKRMQGLSVKWMEKEGRMVPGNIWPGISAEDQDTYNERVKWLNNTPSPMQWVSLEPLLGPIDLGNTRFLAWVVVGGESGPKHRPMEMRWAKDIYEQCVAAKIPFYGKQVSSVRPGVPLEFDGEEIHEWPNIA